MSLEDYIAGIDASLPLPIAKAMTPILARSVKEFRPGLMQLLCEAHRDDPNDDYTARYIATDGNVMLIIDTDLPAPAEPIVFAAASVKLMVQSKGHATPTPTLAAHADSNFPDYRQVIPTTTSPVDRIGFDVQYMDLLLKINRALKLPVPACWSVTFAGELAPTLWEAEKVTGGITRLRLVVMPMRLD